MTISNNAVSPKCLKKAENGTFVDASTLTEFFIDSSGEKHVYDTGNCQRLTCGIDDLVFRDEGSVWSVLPAKTPKDFNKPHVEKAKLVICEAVNAKYPISLITEKIHGGKLIAAQAILYGGDYDDSLKVLLEKEASVKGITMEMLASSIIAANEKQNAVILAIENLRITIPTAVAAARTHADKEKAASEIIAEINKLLK